MRKSIARPDENPFGDRLDCQPNDGPSYIIDASPRPGESALELGRRRCEEKRRVVERNGGHPFRPGR